MNAVLATAPVAAENLEFTGEAQELVTAGEGNGGELQYSLDSVNFAAALPTATDAGNYTVYVRVAGDQNHNDVAGENIAVSIAKANAQFITEPQAVEALVEDGVEHELVTPGATEDGTILYALDDGDFSDELPTAIEAGEYTVYYYVAGDKNHSDSQIAEVTVAVNQLIPTAAEQTTAGVKVTKLIRNDHVLIIRDGKTYSVTGVRVE